MTPPYGARVTLVSTAEQPASKREIRRRVISAREALDHDEPLAQRAARSAGARCTLVEARGASTVSCLRDRSTASQAPPRLIDTLHAQRDHACCFPCCCEDFDLEWAVYEPGALQAGTVRTRRADHANLGRSAIHEAGVIFCPGRCGHPARASPRSWRRLLRPRARPDQSDASRCLLLYDDELLDAVPTEPHDALVDFLCTPARMLEASPGRFEHQGLVGR